MGLRLHQNVRAVHAGRVRPLSSMKYEVQHGRRDEGVGVRWAGGLDVGLRKDELHLQRSVRQGTLLRLLSSMNRKMGHE